nr:hypothetical protein [Paracidobacterium acidisoli]
MRHEQKRCACGKSDDVPSKLPVNHPVFYEDGIRVIEDNHGFLEGDAVLAAVAFGLCLIPLEEDHAYRKIVTTNL